MNRPTNKILVTTFQAFRGRSQNGSQTLGESLRLHAESSQIHILNMPVVWGCVETHALPAIAELQPDLVLGLGEGSPDAFKIETLAYNARSGPDVEGREPPSTTIDPAGPDTIASRWPLPERLPDHCDTPSVISRDAGRYLCNNALYRYAQSSCAHAGFFHLPPQGTTHASDYADRWLPIILELIRFASAAPQK